MFHIWQNMRSTWWAHCLRPKFFSISQLSNKIHQSVDGTHNGQTATSDCKLNAMLRLHLWCGLDEIQVFCILWSHNKGKNIPGRVTCSTVMLTCPPLSRAICCPSMVICWPSKLKEDGICMVAWLVPPEELAIAKACSIINISHCCFWCSCKMSKKVNVW